jgi:hypothetical protein
MVLDFSEPMKKIARSLRQHRELILNYFRAQKLISSGVVEGLNSKAKVTMRKSYGFRTYRLLELALSFTREAARAGIRPRFLLTNLKFSPGCSPGLRQQRGVLVRASSGRHLERAETCDWIGLARS